MCIRDRDEAGGDEDEEDAESPVERVGERADAPFDGGALFEAAPNGARDRLAEHFRDEELEDEGDDNEEPKSEEEPDDVALVPDSPVLDSLERREEWAHAGTSFARCV